MIFKDKETGLKVLGKEEAYWTNVVKNLKAEGENLKNALKANDAFLEAAEAKLKKAK